MVKSSFSKISFLCLLVAGCGFGPHSITGSRNLYNEVINETSSEQLLLNILRARDGEIETFMDVNEVDATVSLGSGVAGGATGLGPAAGSLGAVTGTFTYTDQALVRYIPLSGYPLIAQVSSPITSQTAANLLNSEFPIPGVLAIAFNRLSPGYRDNSRTIDLLTLLDSYGSVTFSSPANGQPTGAAVGAAARTGQSNAKPPETDQALVVSLHNRAPDRFPETFQRCLPGPSESNVQTLWRNFEELYKENKKTTGRVVLRSSSSPGVNKSDFVEFRSALGALKYAATDKTAVVDTDVAQSIRYANAISPCNLSITNSNTFYFVNEKENTLPDLRYIGQLWEAFYKLSLASMDDSNVQADTTFLGQRRRLLLIERSATPSPTAYVQVQRKGFWYSIDNEDKVSKQNFSLLSELLTIQASPQQNSQLTPTVSATGK